ncbi:Uncharacterised protein [BD1-7 clade bacterium]|uniref:TM2 domain-containing protein n=1 Tax=BD1-7 clade bacterium TaxID=2029982 RepID=A0A5S9N4B6_9GAMM|nr:Uncharacterised protein [BD1-7 clade bacterium]CAA0084355.1 Uncharacterised protein [BD1-7 clade bacterium]
MNNQTNNSHSLLIGYILWIFGFMGAHRFYFGKPVSGTIWLFTFGLLGIGWLIDLLLIPAMEREADQRFIDGSIDYSLAWVLLTFLGAFGIHRMYLGKVISGVLMLLVTVSMLGAVWVLPPIALGVPIVLLVVIYDFWTLNYQISEINQSA